MLGERTGSELVYRKDVISVFGEIIPASGNALD
jgi:hypothetical protein